MGVEPTLKAWEALVLPMYYTRKQFASIIKQQVIKKMQ